MVKIELKGFKELEKKIEQLPKELKKDVGKVVSNSALLFQELAFKDAPADVGFLKGQITVKRIDELTSEVVSGSKYSAPMEFGTKGRFQPIPGIDSSQFKGQPTGGTFKDMIKNLTNWVHRKGISGTFSVKTRRRTGSKASQQNQDRELAFVIAMSILRKGIKPHPFFFKQINPVKKYFISNVEKILIHD